MTTPYDAIIIGAGQNGLTCAAYLARAGRRVLVVEGRAHPGGLAGEDRETLPGAALPSGWIDAGLFDDQIIADLDLATYGLALIEPEVTAFAPAAGGRALTLYRDPARSIESIARFSPADAAAFPAFVEQTRRLAAVLDGYFGRPAALADLGSLLVEQPELLEIMNLSAAEFLRRSFQTGPLLGLYGHLATTALTEGPYAQGTGLVLLTQLIHGGGSGYRRVRFVRGGIGRLAGALAGAVQGAGGEIRTGTAVEKILVKNGRAAGVVLAGGEQLTAGRVISSATPWHTCFDLVGPTAFDPTIVRRVRQTLYRGSTARLNLLLTGLPAFSGQDGVESLHGHILVGADLDGIERAFDDTKYGRISDRPVLDLVIPTLHDPNLAPDGHHLLAVTARYAPFALRDGSWPAAGRVLRERILAELEKVAPGIGRLVAGEQLLTPVDYANQLGLTEGCWTHGQMHQAQMFAMRSVVDFDPQKTPIEGLWLCGSGTHPGGELTGRPGKLAAARLLRE